MAIETVTSTFIANRDAQPFVVDYSGYGPGEPISVEAVVAVGVADVGSIYKLFSIPSRAVPISFRLKTSADMGTTTTFDLALYDTTLNGGGLVTDAYFGSGIVTNAGALDNVEILHSNSSLYTIANAGKRIWELVSPALTADPGKDYDVYAITDGACDGAATVKWRLTYKV